MERLTFVKCPKQWGMGKHPTIYTSHKTFQEVVDRLAAYEDTGVEPDMIEATINGQITLQKALARYTQAEERGRLVALPCKVGDTVFGIMRCGKHGNRVVESEVAEMYFAEEDMRLCIVLRRLCRGEWGKAIFGTREEAERALEGGTGNA